MSESDEDEAAVKDALLGDVSAAVLVRRLDALGQAGARGALERHVFSSPDGMQLVTRDLLADREAARSAPGWIGGLLGAIALLRLVDPLPAGADVEAGKDPARAAAQPLLRDAAVAKELLAIYDVDDDLAVTFDSGDLLALGTTSFLLTCRSHRLSTPRVLKCIRPRYLQVEQIATTTQAYDQALNGFDDTRFTPDVHRSGRRYVLMDQVEALTLEQDLVDRVGRLLADDRDRTAIRAAEREYEAALTRALCRAFAALHQHGLQHLDLSPANVFVERGQGEELAIVLIDVGKNYLLQERVGSAPELERAAFFVAPEVRDDTGPSTDAVPPADRGLRADLFSLGRILLWTAHAFDVVVAERGAGARMTELGPAGVPDTLLGLWERSPGLAAIVEDLADRKPEQRLKSFDGVEALAVLEEIRDRVELAQAVEQALAPEASHSGARAALHYAVYGFDRAKDLRVASRAAAKVLERQREQGRDHDVVTPWFGRWRVLRVTVLASAVLWATINTVFLYDLGLVGTVLSPVAWLASGLSWHAFTSSLHGAWDRFQAGRDGFPARAVAWSYGMAMIAYYVNIFSTVSGEGVRGWMASRSLAAMRICPTLSLLCILGIVVFEPSWWPLAAAVLTLLVLTNNLLARRVVTSAADRAKVDLEGPETRIQDSFLEYLDRWPRNVAIYGVIMAVFFGLIEIGRAHDETNYALLIVLINVYFVGYQNCVQQAPAVRANLQRAFFIHRRLGPPAESAPEAEPAAIAAVPAPDRA